jgi:hypothetical protein
MAVQRNAPKGFVPAFGQFLQRDVSFLRFFFPDVQMFFQAFF